MGTQRTSSKSTRPAGFGSRILWRPKVWAGLLLVVLVGVAGHVAWRRFAPTIAGHPQYQITAERIRITPPPPWIRSDVKAEVVHDAGLAGTLSLLEDGERLQQRIRDAFGFHPWVAAVKRIRVDLPASLEVELEYRRPAAVVEAATDDGLAYLPIDVEGVRLPDADFSDVERRLLPRISGVTGRPVVGAPWHDPRVLDGARLVAGLADVWSKLRLVEIVPSPHPQIRGDARFFTFEITTSGGTRIVWGAAPGREQDAGESTFDVKRRRLLDYAAEQGQLDSIDGPAVVDVRSELVVVPRTARRSPPDDDPATPSAR
jgi:hypothetical protein